MQSRPHVRIASSEKVCSKTHRPLAVHRGKLGHPVKRALLVALLAFGLGLFPWMPRTISALADEASDLTSSPSNQLENPGHRKGLNPKRKSGLDSCLAQVPAPQPSPGLHRVVQLVNCASSATLLGAANAAQQKFGNPQPVLPREGTWALGAEGSGKNVLTIDIPLNWEDTKCPPNAHGMCEGIIGPRFWSRTGCRVDIDFDKAQCETGGCGGRYDCSAARLSASAGTTVSEWTFAEPVPDAAPTPTYLKDSPDISSVDGANLNMDIQPLGGDPHDPFDRPPSGSNEGAMGHDIQWLVEQYPLTMHNQDMRADCNPAEFQLRRSSLATSNPYGLVILDDSQQVLGGDYTVACFSNCGRYEFPAPPPVGCDAGDKTSPCYFWKSFCLGDPSQYGPTHPCSTDSDCPVNGACWNNPGSGLDHTCQGRAFVKNAECLPPSGGLPPSPNCPYVTYQYGYVDGVTKPPTTFLSTQPPLGSCSDVSTDPGTCIGDDSLHKTMPKAYTWPNDPQVYGGDSPAYRVIFAPGDTPSTAPKITESTEIPLCSTLPKQEYNVELNTKNCANNINYGAFFAVAHRFDQKPNPGWGCDLDPTGSGDEGVICKWNQPLTAVITQIGLRANFNSKGSTLELSVIPPAQPNSDQGARIGDLLLASITFFSGAGLPKVPGGWSQVPGANVVSNSNDQTVVWYHFVAKGDSTNYTWIWNSVAFPAGGITVWRGVNTSNPFDVPAAIASGTGKTAVAPAVTPVTANTRLLSVFGAGNQNSQVFQQPGGGPGIGADETIALKVIGGPVIKTYYAHEVGDRIQITESGKSTTPQSVEISEAGNASGNAATWDAITIVLRPLA